MSVIIATKQEVQKYYESEALGQSKLKLLLGDLSSFNKEFDSSAEHFLIGSAVDCILTNSRQAFNEVYYISEVEKLPSDTVVSILKDVYENLLKDYAESLEVIQGQENPLPTTSFSDFVGQLSEWRTYILDACGALGWQPRWGADAKYDNIVKDGSEYFMDLCKAFGKTVISKVQASTINSIVISLEDNPRTSDYFDRKTFEEQPRVQVYYQFPLYFEYRNIKCKALLDIVFVFKDEHEKIEAVVPVDLKTMSGNTYYFPNSIKQRRYDIQAAWYTLALSIGLCVPKDRISPFKFIVESTSYQGKPLVFELSDSYLHVGRYGKEAFILEGEILKPEVKGFEQLLDLYIYHSENGFALEKKIQDYGLTPIKVNWDGIV